MKKKRIKSLLRLLAYTEVQKAAARARICAGETPVDAELMVYGDIGESWFGDSVAAREVVAQLNELDAEHILVRINSYGGSVSDGIAIHNALRSHGARITTRVEGTAASIASLIAMAGDDVQMYPNATLMIHAPWTVVAGNAGALRQTAEALDIHSHAMASSYARKTGESVDGAIAVLADGIDHWYTAEQAEEDGYVDTVLSDAEPETDTEARAMPRAAPVFAAMTRYRNAPIQVAASFGTATPHALVSIEQQIPVSQPAASAAQKKEFFMWKAFAKLLGLSLPESMSDAEAKGKVCEKLALSATATDAEISTAVQAYQANPPTAPPAPNLPAIDPAVQARVLAAEATRRADISSRFASFRQNPAAATLERTCLDDMAVTPAAASERLLAQLGQGAAPVGGNGGHVAAGADVLDKQRDAAVQAVLVRAGVRTDPTTNQAIAFDGANPFRGRRLSELARASLTAAGINADQFDELEMVRASMGLTRIRGAQTTSDFPVILESVLHRMVLTGFRTYAATYQRFCKLGDVTDFREWKRLTPGIIANLQEVNEQGEYKNKVLPDAEKLGITVKRRGNIIEVTPETIVNDDLGTITDMALQLGQAGPRTIERAVYALLAMNGGAGPSITVGGVTGNLFSAGFKNIDAAPAALSTITLAKGSDAMSEQTAPGPDAEFLDIKPAVSVSRHTLARTVQVLVNSEYDPEANNKLQRPNQVRGMVGDIVGSPRIASTTGVYLFADPNMAPVIEVAFLNGQREVRVVQDENFRTAGIAWRGELPFGVAPIGYRGGYYLPGA